MVTPQTWYRPPSSVAKQEIRRKRERKTKRDERDRKRHSLELPSRQQGNIQALPEHLQCAWYLVTCFMEAWEVDMYIIPISQTRILRLREVK